MNEPKSVRYQRLRRRARLAALSAGAGWLAFLSLTTAARQIFDVALGMTAWLPAPLQPAAAIVLFVALLVLCWQILALPATLYVGVYVDRRFGLAGQAPRELLVDQLRTGGIGVLAALLLAGIVALAGHVSPARWWLLAGGISALMLGAALRFASELTLGLGETRPIRRAALMSALREVARRAGVPLSDIREWLVGDTSASRPTALVTGVGSNRRVLVASEVLRDWSDDEVAVVVAHELAHHVHGDLWRTLALDAAVLSAAFWTAARAVVAGTQTLGLSGPGDPAALPLMALVAGGVWLAATPVRYAQSRAQERRADRFALRLTREGGAFGAALRRLSARHLAEERPSRLTRWFFHRHPPVAERLAMAERYAGATAATVSGPRSAPRAPHGTRGRP
jgi:STE24 endopeptidase